MKVEEARDVCKDRNKWMKLMLAPMRNRRDVVYACIIKIMTCLKVFSKILILNSPDTDLYLC
jgi:hypothetical protein